MSVRVPVMTIGSDSGGGVGDESCAWQIDVATAITKSAMEFRERASLQRPGWRTRLAFWRSRPVIAGFPEGCFCRTPKPTREVRPGLALRALPRQKNCERFFCTSNPPVSRGELAAEPFAPLSFFFFAKKFFRGPSRTGGFRNRFTAKTQTHEVRIWVQRHAGE